MAEADVQAILRIERASFSMPWSEAAFYQEIYKQYAMCRVAESKGRVAGYICVNVVLDECHLLNLAVHPDFRRRGIATMLVEDMLKEAKSKDCRFVYLEVRISNAGAKAFYERFGFGIAGIRKNYYTFPIEDAIILVLKV